MSLNDRFADSRGQPIQFRGREVTGMLRIDVRRRSRLTVRLLSTRSAWPQGLAMKLVDGGMTLESVHAASHTLWASDVPSERTVELEVSAPTTLRVWNVWQYEDGQTQAWVNNAAIDVTGGDGKWLLRCSDGYGEPDFENLVAELVLRDD